MTNSRPRKLLRAGSLSCLSGAPASDPAFASVLVPDTPYRADMMIISDAARGAETMRDLTGSVTGQGAASAEAERIQRDVMGQVGGVISGG